LFLRWAEGFAALSRRGDARQVGEARALASLAAARRHSWAYGLAEAKAILASMLIFVVCQILSLGQNELTKQWRRSRAVRVRLTIWPR
jgi:hypothetical protein